MRLTYLVLAHRYPDQVVRLIRRLATPSSSFLLHWDARSSASDLDHIVTAIGPDVRLRLVPRVKCYWGTYSIVDAILAGLHQACTQGDSFDYLVLMSGQDYPIKSTDRIEEFFVKKDGGSIIHHLPFPMPHWDDGGWDRVGLRHYPPGNHAYIRTRLAKSVLPRRTFPESLRPYGGAHLWALARDAAFYLDDYSRSHPDILRYFELVRFPCEIYIQSVLGNAPFADSLQNDTLHFEEWDRDGLVLLNSDMPSLSSTWHLFARKFDCTVDCGVLDEIDAALLGV